MRVTSRLRLIVAVLATMNLTLSCAFRPSSRIFHRDNIELSGRIVHDKDSATEYYFVDIGTPPDPLDHLPSVAVELRSGEHLWFSQIVFSDLPEQAVVERIDYGEPNTTLVSLEPGYNFWFVEQRPVRIVIRGSESVLVDRNLNRYPFPLSDSDAEKLFGKPDRVYDTTIK